MKILTLSLGFNLAIACVATTITALTPHSPDPSLETLLFYILLLPANLVFLLGVESAA